MSHNFDLLHVDIIGGVAWATIDNPPINLMTLELFEQLAVLAGEIEADDSAQVLVLQSANPDFFIAHFDVEAILGLPVDGDATPSAELNTFHVMCERMRTMPKATICKIAGRVGGGGSEFAASCDMRFGVLGSTIVNQMEVPLGILPGGTGTQRLPRLMGRGRALELILGGVDLDAFTADRWGYLNRAFASTEEMDDYVADLAARIAAAPREAVALAKRAVLASEPSWHDGLVEEAYLFERLLRTREAPPAMRRFLDLGGQTPDIERRMGEVTKEVGSTA